jgi:hypothetical protein
VAVAPTSAATDACEGHAGPARRRRNGSCVCPVLGAMSPVAWLPLSMLDGEDQQVVRLDGARGPHRGTRVPHIAGHRPRSRAALGRGNSSPDGSLNLRGKALSQSASAHSIRPPPRTPPLRQGETGASLRQQAFHAPETSAAGMGFTLPERTSSRRRRASPAHCCSSRLRRGWR